VNTGNPEPAVVGQEQSAAAQRGHPYGSILVALDGSPLAERVLPYIESLAVAFSSQVICLCAVEPISPTLMAEASMPGAYSSAGALMETQEELRTEDASYLDRIKEQLARQGIAVQCEEPEGRAAEAIVAAARTHRVDLIAMTTHGRSGLGRALLGSVANEVVRTAPCPVLLVRLTPK
jgi:nucleotide-binding universal stress UspA family protein